jgi:thiamine-phosphate pyrophosphorylase
VPKRLRLDNILNPRNLIRIIPAEGGRMYLKYFQILDININRITGSLRILEDISRVYSRDLQKFSLKFKHIRHSVNSLFALEDLLSSRNTEFDNGKFLNPEYEIKSKQLIDVIIANLRRISESLRVLEEISKCIDKDNSITVKKIRFNYYDIEQSFFYEFKKIQMEEECTEKSQKKR